MGDRYSARTGMEGMPKLVGMNKSKDPASLADNEFAQLENVRIQGGRIKSRGGQGKVTDPASGCVEGIFPVKSPCPGPSYFNVKNQLFRLDPSGIGVNLGHERLLIGHHDNKFYLYYPEVGTGFTIIVTLSEDGETITDVVNMGITNRPKAETVKFGSLIYIITDNAIHTLDSGGTLLLDYDGATNPEGIDPFFAGDLEAGEHQVAAELAGDLYVMATSYQQILKRTAAGVWSIQLNQDFASFPEANGLSLINTRQVIEYDGELLIGRHGTWPGRILVYTGGATVALKHDIIEGNVISQFFKLNGKLYYLYSTLTAPVNWRIGVYDGAEWIDNHYNFGEVPILSCVVGQRCVRAFRLNVSQGTTWTGQADSGIYFSHGGDLTDFTAYHDILPDYAATDNGHRSILGYFAVL